jgi:hypothetical protein
MHGLEIERTAIEILAHVLVVDELAAQVVGPLVIRTDEIPHDALASRAQSGATVAADIVEGAHRQVVVPHDDHGVGADFHRKEVAGLRNLL